MSAENALRVFRMVNGEYWIVVEHTGDVAAEVEGTCGGPIAKCASYDDAERLIEEMDDERSPNYVYTEHGGGIAPRAQMEAEPPRFCESWIDVVFTGRGNCRCTDFRDINVRKWSVTERPHPYDDVPTRIIASKLWYAEAITLANYFGDRQPGKCFVSVPKLFRAIDRSRKHVCHEWPDEPAICLPAGTPSWIR